eukprot:Pompholyxophrys_punicea_v1_NODE_640_length_1540_cov_18.216835.p1 type:complete len:209 gc:universal NODE_640_length_1540_cov_18.216835:373-999(+)
MIEILEQPASDFGPNELIENKGNLSFFLASIVGFFSMAKTQAPLVNLNSSKEALCVSLLYSASRGNIEGVQLIIENELIDIDTGDYDKRTALHVAAGEGHYDIVKYLVERGASVNVKDRTGGTPLSDSIRAGHERVSKYLLEHGANPPQERFELELITFSSAGKFEEVERLLKNQISPNCADYDGRTPLHLAASNRHVKGFYWVLFSK